MLLKTVMIVDDEEDIRTIAELSLGSVGGWQVAPVASGDECLASVGSTKPDLILLDVRMPGLDGPATLDRLRDDPQTRAIPVVFLTARVQRDEIEALKAQGAIGVINKPFDPMTLPTELMRLTANLP